MSNSSLDFGDGWVSIFRVFLIKSKNEALLLFYGEPITLGTAFGGARYGLTERTDLLLFEHSWYVDYWW
jgi:hypothetical protein